MRPAIAMVKPSVPMCVFCAFRTTSTRKARLLASARYRLRGRQVHFSATRSQGQNAAFRSKEDTEEENGYSAWQPTPSHGVSKWARGTGGEDNGVNTAINPSASSHWAATSQLQYNTTYHTPSQIDTSSSSATPNSSNINWPSKPAWNNNTSSNYTPSGDTMQSQTQPQTLQNNGSTPSWAAQSLSPTPSSSSTSPWSNQSSPQTLNSPSWGTQSHDSSLPSTSTASHNPSSWSTAGAASKWAKAPKNPPSAFTGPNGSNAASLHQSAATPSSGGSSQASANDYEAHSALSTSSPWKSSPGVNKWARSSLSSSEVKDTQDVSSYQVGQQKPWTQDKTSEYPRVSLGSMGNTAPASSIWQTQETKEQAHLSSDTTENSAPVDQNPWKSTGNGTGLSPNIPGTGGQTQSHKTGGWSTNNEMASWSTDGRSPTYSTISSATTGANDRAKPKEAETNRWPRSSSTRTQPTNQDVQTHNPLDFSAETLLGRTGSQKENTVQRSAQGASTWGSSTSLSSDADVSSMFDLSAEALLGRPAAPKDSLTQNMVSKTSKWAKPSQGVSASFEKQGGSDIGLGLEHLSIGKNNAATGFPSELSPAPSNWTSSVAASSNWTAVHDSNSQIDTQYQGISPANLYGTSAEPTTAESLGKPKAKNWARTKPADAPVDSTKPRNWGSAGGSSVLTPTHSLEPVSFAPQSEQLVEKSPQYAGNVSSMKSFKGAGELPGFKEPERDQFASLVDSMESHQRQRRSTWSVQSPRNGQQSSPLSQGSQDERPNWAQQPRNEHASSWMRQPRDERGSSWYPQEGRNSQSISWRQQSRDNINSGSWLQDSRREASWSDESDRGYNNDQRSFQQQQQQQQPQRDFGVTGKPKSFGSDEYVAEVNATHTRPKYDAEVEVGWKKKKKKDFKSKDRQKHGREFLTDDLSIEEEMRAMMAAKQARKQASYQEIQKLPEVYLPEYISIGNLAHLLKVHLEPFTNKLRQLGFEDTNPDYVLNAENAGLIAMEYNYEPKVDTSAIDDLFPRPLTEDKSNLPLRPPVVTIMGHVDHGKTTILDWLRKSSIAAGEFGGITQHIGAFSVPMPSGQVITFLDTPGHAAFLTMRERGANITDIVILVVAADDGVMPQTIEAIKHAQAAKVPMIVAINKCDKPEANPQRVKTELGRYNVELEEFGGDTQVVEVSGLKGLGMEELEESTILLSEVLDMRADPTGPCEGWVIEATTKKRGRVATILVRCGTLKVGDVLVAGTSWTRVKTLLDEHGRELASAGPGMPVEIDGWRDTPVAGDEVLEAPSEDKAKSVVDFRNLKIERAKQASDMEAINEARRKERERIEREAFVAEQAKLGIEVTEEAKVDEGPKVISVPYIVKADVYGSVEAVSATILSIGSDEIHSRIVRSGVGPLSQSDIDFAAAVGATCITFNVETDPIVAAAARGEKVDILEHNIIYQVESDVKERMSAKLPPTINRTVTGEADVAQIFDYNMKGRTFVKVAGCKVRNGVMKRNSRARVLRKKQVVYDGVLTTLKHVKKDVAEMRKNNECGISFENWQDFQEGDAIQCYDEVSTPRSLP